MSLLHRRAAQLLTRGDSEREDRLSLIHFQVPVFWLKEGLQLLAGR